jgi:FdhD protein
VTPSPAPPGIATRTVLRVRDGAARPDEDALAVEEPLEIRLDLGHRVQRLAITMRTPGHDADLAVGFLVGEGVLTAPDDIVETRPGARDCGLPDPNVVVVRLRDGLAFDAARLERHVYTTSSCGVCGKASLEAVRVIAGPGLPEGPTLRPDVLCALPDTLRRHQAVFEQTGGLHAAALFDADGGLLRVREDVGRHNAVDKLVGSFWLDGCAVPPGVLLVSGRASFELVQKALAAGIPALAAVGAPSSLAVDLAADHGLTLVGFLRDGRFNLYAGAGRVRTGAAPPRT